MHAQHVVAQGAGAFARERVVQVPGVVRLGQDLHLRQGRQITVHAEHAVGQDQAPAGAGRIFTQQLVEMIEIVVAEQVRLGAGELGARQ